MVPVFVVFAVVATVARLLKGRLESNVPNGQTDPVVHWAHGLDANLLNIWRDTLAQQRQLSSDVWHGIMFFVAVNGALVAGGVTLVRSGTRDQVTASLLLGLALLGVTIVWLAKRLMKKQRDYYLEVLFKKAIIERALGFYAVGPSTMNLVLPWNITRQHLEAAEQNFASWQRRRRYASGTVTHDLKRVYDVLTVLYVAAVALIIWAMCTGLFARTAGYHALHQTAADTILSGRW
jgi:hypothetical protein